MKRPFSIETQKRIGRVTWTLVIIWPLAWLAIAAMSSNGETYVDVGLYGAVLLMLAAALFGYDDPNTWA